MKLKCTFKFDYPSKKIATVLHNSLQLDNKDFITTAVKNNILIAEVTAVSVPSLLHTINDFLSCVTVGEQLAIRPINKK